MVLVDNGVNIGVKRQQLMDCLVDYVENSPHFYKNVDKAAEGERADRKNRIVPAAGPGFRDLGRRGLKAVEETAASNETGLKEEKEELRDRTGHSRTEKPAGAPGGKNGAAQGERTGARFSVLSRKKKEEGSGESSPREERDKGRNGDELARSSEDRRESLDQIAAGREGGKREEPSSGQTEKEGLQRAKKELKPEDLKLLGDILQEYLT